MAPFKVCYDPAAPRQTQEQPNYSSVSIFGDKVLDYSFLQSSVCAALFILSYLAVVFEHQLRIDKAASALVGGMLCWAVLLVGGNTERSVAACMESLAHSSAVLFFLLSAMTIVEIIDSHDGFALLRRALRVRTVSGLVWMTALFSFFLSAIIDNLTTSIVMASISTGLLARQEQRWAVASLIIIVANAGGAWSPLGDVTTTMLWIGKNLHTDSLILHLFLPSLACGILPTWWIARSFKGLALSADTATVTISRTPSKLILVAGLGSFLVVPIVAASSSIPPFAVMLLMLGVLWLLTGIVHRHREAEQREQLSASAALQRIDTPSILFFLGILMSISALEHAQILHGLSTALSQALGDLRSVAIALGLLSAVIDNIPLVAAAQAMYPLTSIPANHVFWELLALCTATGGSIMIVGSAAGVAMMGMENIPFLWYLKRVGPLAFVAMTAAVLVYLVQHSLLSPLS